MASHFDFVKFAGKTDVGRKRKNNEDNFGMFPEIGVWLVADGMGGGEDGEVASAAVVRAVSGFAAAHPFPANAAVASGTLVSGLADAIDAASHWIYSRTRERGLKSCASTVVGVALDRTSPGRAIAFHAGDSRLYLLRPDGLWGRGIRRITHDHSAAEAMGVKEKEELNPMWVNVITRAVGLRERTDVERTPFTVRKGDRILICSDGLSGMVKDRKLLEIASGESDVAKAVDKLIAAANEAGGKDNVTAVLVEIGELPKEKVAVKPLKELAVGGDENSDDDARQETLPTLGIEGLTTETVANAERESGGTMAEPKPAAQAQAETPHEARWNRRRLMLWGTAVLMLVLMAVAAVTRRPGPAKVQASPGFPGATDCPPELGVPVVETNAQPGIDASVAETDVPPEIDAPEAVTNAQPTVDVPMAGTNAPPEIDVSDVVTSVLPEPDRSMAAMATAFERKSLSQFEGVMKNTLRQSGEEGVKMAVEFSSEMRRVSERATKFVSESRYVKGAGRSADDLIVDFKYALEKAAAVKSRLDSDLLDKWEAFAGAEAGEAATRTLAAALVAELTEALR